MDSHRRSPRTSRRGALDSDNRQLRRLAPAGAPVARRRDDRIDRVLTLPPDRARPLRIRVSVVRWRRRCAVRRTRRGAFPGLRRPAAQQYGAISGRLDIGDPGLAQCLEAGPAVVRSQGDAEEIAELTIEVAEAALGSCEHRRAGARDDGEDAQSDGLACAGVAGDQGKAAFTVLLLTGRRGVGKTTLIRKVAEALPR